MVENKTVELLVAGGQATAGPPLGPALGPLGINIMAVVTKINEAYQRLRWNEGSSENLC